MNPASSSDPLPSDLVRGTNPPLKSETSLTLHMRHPATGESREVSLGYCVPVLLLGPLVLLRRGDWRLAAVSLLLPIIGQICLAPTANRSYLKLLIRRGFRAVSAEPGQVSRIEWQLGMQLPRYTGRSSKPAA
jgi:hypothetical protein